MYSPYYKAMFKRSVYPGIQFDEKVFDNNPKFSVHLPFREQDFMGSPIGKNQCSEFQRGLLKNQFRAEQRERRHYSAENKKHLMRDPNIPGNWCDF